MRTTPLFKPVGVACMLSMARSHRAGANHPRKKSMVISLADERTILAHPCMSPMHPQGLQRRAVYFLLCRFAIRAGDELHKLVRDEFIFDRDEMGQCVCYDERLSKNYNVSLKPYQDERFRAPVIEHDEDVVSTLESLIHHLLVSGSFLFYQCIDSPRTYAWYSTQRVAARRLTAKCARSASKGDYNGNRAKETAKFKKVIVGGEDGEDDYSPSKKTRTVDQDENIVSSVANGRTIPFLNTSSDPYRYEKELPCFPLGIIKSAKEKGLTMEDLIGPVNNFICVPLQEVSRSAEAVHSNEWNLQDLAGTEYKFVRVSNEIVPTTKEIEIPSAAKVIENGQTDATQTPMQIDTTPGVGSGTNEMTDDWLDEVDWNMWDDRTYSQQM
ncbi:unnamed protein product [Calypogeia fissa]